MTEKEIFILSDPLVEPTREFLSQVLGEKEAWWIQIRAYAMDEYPGITEIWRYYNDGKQWLYRLMRKKKTICWMAVMAGTFRVTFYFGQKAESLIQASDLPDNVKQGFLDGPSYGKIKAISVKMEERSDVELVLQLVDLKVKLK